MSYELIIHPHLGVIMDCIFCKIISGEAKANLIYQDDTIIAFDDLFPKAPQHKLIIPRKHIATLNDITAKDKDLLGHMMLVASDLAKKYNIAESGYRVLVNCNADGGQAVYHLHLHLIGGRSLRWPPG